eukprot:CAMPEP_0174895154 /NCGR_PEP_ID=MMETSP0167-20121228/9623_1 /TAXON_ID=38298 /ORGANISM="Rhodella maculata, Strain CCMP736" /LENGTH=419 /DNA_ID=CAMNT_0016134415 /DNA_START=176 /DNA_END=1431 /DNA_ORIENTATION=+
MHFSDSKRLQDFEQRAFDDPSEMRVHPSEIKGGTAWPASSSAFRFRYSARSASRRGMNCQLHTSPPRVAARLRTVFEFAAHAQCSPAPSTHFSRFAGSRSSRRHPARAHVPRAAREARSPFVANETNIISPRGRFSPTPPADSQHGKPRTTKDSTAFPVLQIVLGLALPSPSHLHLPAMDSSMFSTHTPANPPPAPPPSSSPPPAQSPPALRPATPTSSNRKRKAPPPQPQPQPRRPPRAAATRVPPVGPELEATAALLSLTGGAPRGAASSPPAASDGFGAGFAPLRAREGAGRADEGKTWSLRLLRPLPVDAVPVVAGGERSAGAAGEVVVEDSASSGSSEEMSTESGSGASGTEDGTGKSGQQQQQQQHRHQHQHQHHQHQHQHQRHMAPRVPPDAAAAWQHSHRAPAGYGPIVGG